MTIHAYSELYLSDAKRSLANAFDYAINVCKFSPDWFMKLFVMSNKSVQFERGNPAIVSGRSGVELVMDILSEVYPGVEFPYPTFSKGRTPEYWAGWALAQYQWKTAKRFKEIFRRIPLSEIIAMYPLYHEMDITCFIDEMDRRYNAVVLETKLRKFRKYKKLSQSELAYLSGVNVRSIQLYEQRVNDIDKAEAHTLYKLSRVLGCGVEDLLESPEKDVMNNWSGVNSES